MCLALPAEVVAVDGETATVDVGGVRSPVSLAFLEDVSVGEFVVIHVGYALSKIDETAAKAQLAALAPDVIPDALTSEGAAP